MSATLIEQIEQRTDKLIAHCAKLERENQKLLARQKELEQEHTRLAEKNDLARSRIAAMVSHLKALDVQ